MDSPGYQEALRRIETMGMDRTLDLFNLNLTVCPPLPNTLITLYIQNNNLRELPNFLDVTPNLVTLYCSHNQLTVLPELPQNLQMLNCSHNQLTVLPELPQNLGGLICSHNQLTVLQELPQNVISLDCQVNQLTVLPELPSNLEYLYCSKNQLKSLPKLPSKLQVLLCSNNKITTIPELPILSAIDFNMNPLIEPFRKFQNQYKDHHSVYEFISRVNAYYKSIRAKGRNVSALKQTLGRTGPLPENIASSIGSFLSGKPGTLNMQTVALKQNTRIKGGKRGRRTRRRQINSKVKKTRGRKYLR